MRPEKVLYTDGHEVTVTESFFQVKKTMYQLKGIIHHDFLVIQPHRIPALLMMLIGALTILVILQHWSPIKSIPELHLFSIEIHGAQIVTAIGATLLVTGTLILITTKERYAIHIETAEGERNVLVSKRKEYITQILDALNRAFMSLVDRRKGTGSKAGRTFVVGSR
jgi:hypothetical protein